MWVLTKNMGKLWLQIMYGNIRNTYNVINSCYIDKGYNNNGVSCPCAESNTRKSYK